MPVGAKLVDEPDTDAESWTVEPSGTEVTVWWSLSWIVVAVWVVPCSTVSGWHRPVDPV